MEDSFKRFREQIVKGVYRHFKGNLYEMLAIARHSETEEPMVVYRPLARENDIWVRPASMWSEEVEYGGETVKRFCYVGQRTSDLEE